MEIARYFADDITVDPRLREREIGSCTKFTQEIWRKQYTDPDLCAPGGESFRTVRTRMEAAIRDILHKTPTGGSAVAISHAAAICAYLQGFYYIRVTDADRKWRQIVFRDHLVWNGPIQTPSCFRVMWDDGVVDVQYLGSRSANM